MSDNIIIFNKPTSANGIHCVRCYWCWNDNCQRDLTKTCEESRLSKKEYDCGPYAKFYTKD